MSLATGAAALAKMRARMLASEEGAAILRERPTVTSETARALAALPPSTFGGAYHAFMAKRGFSPDDRPAVRFVDDPDLAYVARRAREAHDFWHVLFGCPTTVLGELALKGVELAQVSVKLRCGDGPQVEISAHKRGDDVSLRPRTTHPAVSRRRACRWACWRWRVRSSDWRKRTGRLFGASTCPGPSAPVCAAPTS